MTLTADIVLINKTIYDHYSSNDASRQAVNRDDRKRAAGSGKDRTMNQTKYSGISSGKLEATKERYGLGRAAVEKIASACNAKVKIGSAAVYLWDRMDKHLQELADSGVGEEASNA